MLGSSKPNGARIRPSTSGGPRQNFGSPTVILTGTPCAASHVANLPVTYVLNPSGRIVGGQILGPVSEQVHSQALLRYVHAALKS